MERETEDPTRPESTGISRLKLFLALSRTPHGILDMATPALGALLWLGGLPPAGVIALGFLTAFAGYTAVYALNDVVDYRVDREEARPGVSQDPRGTLATVFVRPLLGHVLLTLEEALLWTGGWALTALIGAYLLNPICAVIFLAGGLLEAIYCLLLRVTYLRSLVSGMVKTLGAIAAVFAVDPEKSTLTYVDNHATRGKTPRGFGIDPTGTFLLAAHQDSNNVVVFRIDAGAGKLAPTGQQLKVKSPVCVKFLPLR